MNLGKEPDIYIYRKKFESALVLNAFSVAYARRDEPDERDERE